MASRTLQQDMASDFYANVLDVNSGFAKTITFYPAMGGESRRIVAVVSQSQRPEEGPLVDYTKEEVRVTVGRTESHAKGGVDVPVMDGETADAIARDGDSEQQKFAFTGEVINRTSYSLTMRFERPIALRLGSGARRR